jgi:hypothetical protein
VCLHCKGGCLLIQLRRNDDEHCGVVREQWLYPGSELDAELQHFSRLAGGALIPFEEICELSQSFCESLGANSTMEDG